MFTKQLKRGSIGFEVYNLQSLLMSLGFGQFTPSIIFGPKTEQAVKDFQIAHALEPVGEVGPKTRAALNRAVVSPSERIYWAARSCLGIDASPNDIAPDAFACAETVWAIISKAEPLNVGFPFTASTAQMSAYLSQSPLYERVEYPERGVIVISPTGWGNGFIPNGHVGIVSNGDLIMSNTSRTGTFDENYTTETWNERYVKNGGFPVFYYKKIK